MPKALKIAEGIQGETSETNLQRRNVVVIGRGWRRWTPWGTRRSGMRGWWGRRRSAAASMRWRCLGRRCMRAVFSIRRGPGSAQPGRVEDGERRSGRLESRCQRAGAGVGGVGPQRLCGGDVYGHGRAGAALFCGLHRAGGADHREPASEPESGGGDQRHVHGRGHWARAVVLSMAVQRRGGGAGDQRNVDVDQCAGSAAGLYSVRVRNAVGEMASTEAVLGGCWPDRALSASRRAGR